jgi:hypothetical protein
MRRTDDRRRENPSMGDKTPKRPPKPKKDKKAKSATV